MNRQKTQMPKIVAACLSTLILSSSVELRSEWQDWAIGGAVAASVGGIIYWATRPEAPDKVKRNAEACYTSIVDQNYDLVRAFAHHPHKATEDIILFTTQKGRSYTSNRWFISDSDYLSYDCLCHTPLVRGYAALLEESEALLSHRKKLIKCFGSVSAARREYYNFDNLESYAYTLQRIAQNVERHSSFMTARDAFNMHRANVRRHEELQWQLAQTQREVRNLRRY